MSRRTCCSMILVLGMVLALFAVAGPSQAAIQWAGASLVNLNAETLGLANGAEVTAWPNTGTAGGTFVPDPAPPSGSIGTPNMATLAIGQSGANKKVVRFQAVNPGDFSAANVDCLQLDAAQVPAALTSNAPTFSVEFWAYKATAFGNQSVVSWGRRAQSDYRGAGAAAAYFHTASAAGGRAITIGDGTDPDGFPAFAGTYTPVFNKFTHFTYTYSTATKQLKFYINGVLNRSLACNNWWPAEGFPMQLGMSRGTYGSNTGNPLGGIGWSTEEERRAACLNFLHSGLDGGIAQLRIHGGVLTAAQVWNNFAFEAPDYVLTADMPAAPTWEAPVINDAGVPASVSVRVTANLTWGPVPLTNGDYIGIPVWSITGAPAGLAITPDTGVITWTGATPVGTHPFTVTITTAEGTDSVPFTVVVLGYAKPVIDKAYTPSLVKATLGSPLAIPAPVMLEPGWLLPTWTLDATSLGRGMTINAATGAISWANPTPIGSYPAVATVTNAQGSDTLNLTVKVATAVNVVPPAAGDLFFAVDSTKLTEANGVGITTWDNTAAGAAAAPEDFLVAGGSAPPVEVIDGVKWTKIVKGGTGDFQLGSTATDAPSYGTITGFNGASIVTVVRPKRVADTGEDVRNAVVDIFNSGNSSLALFLRNNGKVAIHAGPDNWTVEPAGVEIADGQKAILSLVVQPDGTWKLFVNGAEKASGAGPGSGFTQLDPGAFYQDQITIGGGYPADGWSWFNGNIGNSYVWKSALSDGDRAALENSLMAAFGMNDPSLTLSTTAIDFGKMKPGSSTPAQTVTITNTGQGELTFNAIEKRGANAADFVMTPDPASVAPLLAGQNRTFTVAFAPQLTSGAGAKTASIVFGTPTGATTINLSGISGYGHIELLRPLGTVLELGDPGVGVTGRFSDVRMLNTGADVVTLKSIATTGDFQATPPAEMVVPIDAASTVKVAAHPTASGQRDGKLVITYDPGNGVDVSTTVTLVSNTTNRWYVDAARPDDTGDGRSPAAAKQTLQAAFNAAKGTPGAVVQVASGAYSGATQRLACDGAYDSVRIVGVGATKPLLTQVPIFARNGGVEEFSLTLENLNIDSQEQTWEWDGMINMNGTGSKNLTVWDCDFNNQTWGDPQTWRAINCWNSPQMLDAVIEDCTFTGPDTGRDGIGIYNTWGYVGIRNCQFTGLNDQVYFGDHNAGQFLAEITDSTFAGANNRSLNIWNSPDGEFNVSGCAFNDNLLGAPIIGMSGNGSKYSIENTTIVKTVNGEALMWPSSAIYMENASEFNFKDLTVTGGPTTTEGIMGPPDGSTINMNNVTVEGFGTAGVNLWSVNGGTVNITGLKALNNGQRGDIGMFIAPFGGATVTVTDSVFIGNLTGGATIGCWDGVVSGSAVFDRCWAGAPAGGHGFGAYTLGSLTVRNSVVEGGDNGIYLSDANVPVSRVENCTLIGTDASGTVAIGQDAGAPPPVVVNTIALGYTALDSGVAWDAASSNNIAFAEGATGLVDPKLAFQGGAAFARPADISAPGALRDYLLTAASTAAKGMGVYLGDPWAWDYNGSFRPNPPSIGAFEGPNAAPVIVAIPDTNAGYGLPFTLIPALSAGYPSPVWTLDAASLARGLTIDAATGVISWDNPTPLGTNTVTVTATNDSGADSKSFALTVASIPPVIQPFDPDTFRALAGVPWESPVPVLLAGAPAPVWTLDLEPNPSTAAIIIDPATGQVSWADPIAGVDATVTVVATTGVGSSDSVSFRLIVFTEGVAPVVAPFSPETVSADIGAAFTGPHPTFSVEGVPSPTWSFTVDPAAAGMEINLYSGVATWSPTEWGLYTITVKAENAFGDSSQSYRLRVSKPTRAGNWMLYE